MEEKKKHLSLPANYVTIVDLKERWMKKQKEKEHQQQKLKGQEKQAVAEEPEDRQLIETNSEINPKRKIRMRFRRYNHEKERKEHAPGFNHIVAKAAEVNNGDQMIRERKAKDGKRDRKKKREYLKRGDELIKQTVQSVPEKDVCGEADEEGQNSWDEQKSVSDRTADIEPMIKNLSLNDDQNVEIGRRFKDVSVNGLRRAKIEPRFKDPSLNGENGRRRVEFFSVNDDTTPEIGHRYKRSLLNAGRERSTGSKDLMAGHTWRNRGTGRNRGYGRSERWDSGWKKTGSSFVWVRKGEAWEAAEAELERSSGDGGQSRGLNYR